MSYEIVKGLKINTKNNEVWLKSDSNNVFPKHFEWFEVKGLSKMLKEDGKKAVEKVILRDYWSGNFQGSNNIYDKTVKYYKNKLPYTWDNVGEEKDVGKNKYGSIVEYTNDELEESLYDCLIKFKHRDLSKKWVILRNNGMFVRGKTKLSIKLVYTTDRAKKFNSYEEASIYAEGNVVEIDKI